MRVDGLQIGQVRGVKRAERLEEQPGGMRAEGYSVQMLVGALWPTTSSLSVVCCEGEGMAVVRRRKVRRSRLSSGLRVATARTPARWAAAAASNSPMHHAGWLEGESPDKRR